MRRVSRFYHLNKPKLRQTWNKHNIYNLYRSVGREPLVNRNATFFQQKWAAKSKTRGYHGDHIQEKKWKRLFSRRLRSVVDMPPKYLAAYDGSEQATGRGSGLTTTKVTAESYSNSPKYDSSEPPVSGRKGDVNKLLAVQFPKMTPYMQMTYAPLERRLETAIYRALFASSIREARQFCIHGAVKVNGLKMVYPAYELNPGDMFEVDVEKVLYATGVQRNPGLPHSGRWLRSDRRFLKKEWVLYLKATALEDGEALLGKEVWERHKARNGDGPVSQAYLRQMMVEAALQRTLSTLQEEQKTQAYQERCIRRLISTSRAWLRLPDDWVMPPERLINALWQLFPNPQWHPRLQNIWLKKRCPQVHGEARYLDRKILRRLGMSILDLPQKLVRGPKMNIGPVAFSHDQVRELVKLIREVSNKMLLGREPYQMPWQPRPYMSAFCFIPRYLEVNPYICAAVYLRHPVARKGLGEVPTPFNYLTSQLAHNWYLERG
ncbi:hypothetical protein L249_4287 [Ophiocordyceps polyrhachis-furcata BCC 54312]|uniref:RNA-binding S4 domain-containing protein n=1 Tax=Ophiocordyceps polyrhachis-furcata BCC 54312 TaxID=1330021 RepID=A0A367L7Y9_9HYPO|nr:hypothetical protein L249_4287 [Ophiocordyceps polyrhachis-furcata BCC 54312]